MKKNRILTLSVAALLGFGTVASLGIHASAKKAVVANNAAFQDSTTVDSIGSGFDFGNHIKRAGEVAQISPTIGVQVLDGTEGTKSLRFVAAMTSYYGLESASWTRAAIASGGTTVKEAYTADVTKVYSSIANADTIKWSTTLDTSYQYYMVYTLANIPSAFDFTTIDVTFSATKFGETDPVTATQKANIKGVEGKLDVYGKYTYFSSYSGVYTDSAGGYSVYKDSNTYNKVTEVAIPEQYYEVEGYVAYNQAPVTSVNSGSSTGAFESSSTIKKVVLPDTIKFIGGTYTFASMKAIEWLNVPVNVKYIGNYWSPNSTGLKIADVFWNAKEVQTYPTGFRSNIGTLHIGSTVEKLPANFFQSGSTYTADKIIYDGTEAEWAALLAASAGCGLDTVEMVVCSDTVVATVTFDLDGGKIGDNENPAVVVPTGKSVSDPGVPQKAGKLFEGWYTAKVGGMKVTFPYVASESTTIYAHYEELVGESVDNPIVKTAEFSEKLELNAMRPDAYVKFKAPRTDRYYIYLNRSESSLSGKSGSSTTNSTSYATVQLVDSTGAVTFNSSPTYSMTLATSFVDGNITGTGELVAVDMREDQEINIKYTGSYYASYTEMYGTISVGITSSQGDLESEAGSVAYGEQYEETMDSYNSVVTSRVYKEYIYTPEESGSAAFFTERKGYVSGSYVIKEAGASGKELKKGSSFTDTTIVDGFEAGKDYIIALTFSTDLTKDDYSFSWKLDDAPGGTSIDNALDAFPIGTETTVVRNGTDVTWYNLTITEAGMYKIGADAGSYNSRKVELFAADGTTSLGKNSSNYSADPFYVTLEAGNYYLKFEASTSSTVKATVALVAPGSEIKAAIDTDFSNEAVAVGESLTLNASADGVWYKFTGTLDSFKVATTSETASVVIYNTASISSYTTPTQTITNTAGKFKADDTTKTYYAKVVETDTTKTTVTVAKSEHVGPLTGSAIVGSYVGKYVSPSYQYSYSQTSKVTTDTIGWQSDNLDVETVVTENGITHASAKKVYSSYTNQYEFYGDGTRAFTGYTSGSSTYWGFFSKNIAKTDSITSTAAEAAKTDGFTFTSGSVIVKLTEDDGTVVYGAFIDGVPHFNIDIQFLGDATSIKTTKDAEFQVIENGEAIAQYKVKTGYDTTSSYAASLVKEDITPVTPGESEPAAYVGTFASDDYTIVINANGTLTINGEAYEYEVDKDGDLTITSEDFSLTYYEGLISYDSENDSISVSMYGNDDVIDDETIGRFKPAAPVYCGVFKSTDNRFTLTIDSDGTMMWNDGSNDYSSTYTYNESTKVLNLGAFAAFDRTSGNTATFTGDGYDNLTVSIDDDYGENPYTGTFTRVTA